MKSCILEGLKSEYGITTDHDADIEDIKADVSRKLTDVEGFGALISRSAQAGQKWWLMKNACSRVNGDANELIDTKSFKTGSLGTHCSFNNDLEGYDCVLKEMHKKYPKKPDFQFDDLHISWQRYTLANKKSELKRIAGKA